MALTFRRIHSKIVIAAVNDLRIQLESILTNGQSSQYRAKLTQFKLFCNQQATGKNTQDFLEAASLVSLVRNEEDCFDAFLPQLQKMIFGEKRVQQPSSKQGGLKRIRDIKNEIQQLNSAQDPELPEEDPVLEALHKSQIEREKISPIAPAQLTISSIDELKDDSAWDGR